MTDTSLEPIMTDLINEVFKGAVTLEDLVVHLKDTAQRDLENASAKMILDAIRGIEKPPKDWNDPKDSHIDWKEIRFGCEETLAFCRITERNMLRTQASDDFNENMDMCMFFLCAALLNDATRKVFDPQYLASLRYTLSPFHLYEDITGLFVLDSHLERLLRYIFRP